MHCAKILKTLHDFQTARNQYRFFPNVSYGKLAPVIINITWNLTASLDNWEALLPAQVRDPPFSDPLPPAAVLHATSYSILESPLTLRGHFAEEMNNSCRQKQSSI